MGKAPCLLRCLGRAGEGEREGEGERRREREGERERGSEGEGGRAHMFELKTNTRYLSLSWWMADPCMATLDEQALPPSLL